MWIYFKTLSCFLVINHCLLTIVLSQTIKGTTTPIAATHIVSYVSPKKANAKYTKINDEFSFESFIDMDKNAQQRKMKSRTEQFLGKILQAPKPTQMKFKRTDDQLNSKENTLENTNDDFGRIRNDSDSGLYLRFKQSIPVLEPVRHLLNTVREGGFNHTVHFNMTRHHLVNPSEVSKNNKTGDDESSSDSSAIETKADRDSAENSTSFKVLDFFGSIGSMIWSFLMNVKRWFAASSGNASAAFSSGSF